MDFKYENLQFSTTLPFSFVRISIISKFRFHKKKKSTFWWKIENLNQSKIAKIEWDKTFQQELSASACEDWCTSCMMKQILAMNAIFPLWIISGEISASSSTFSAKVVEVSVLVKPQKWKLITYRIINLSRVNSIKRWHKMIPECYRWHQEVIIGWCTSL